MKKFKEKIAITFGAAVVILAIPMILSIWDIIDPEIGAKSFQTLGIIFLCLFIVLLIVNNLNKGK